MASEELLRKKSWPEQQRSKRSPQARISVRDHFNGFTKEGPERVQMVLDALSTGAAIFAGHSRATIGAVNGKFCVVWGGTDVI
jgi:hypothetical protein